MKRLGLLLLVLLTIACDRLAACDIFYTRTSTATELCSNNIISMFIDSKGNKWFATDVGVSKFDGNRWISYELNNYLFNGIESFNAIAEDSVGNIWFAMCDGFAFLKNNSLYCTTGWGNYRSLIIDGKGNKWLSTDNGIGKEGTTHTSYTTANGLVNDKVYTIAIDHKSNKWIGTDGGVSKFNDTTWTNYTSTNGLVSNKVYAIAVDGFGNIWFGTDGGVSMFNGTTWTNYTIANDLACNQVSAIAIDNSGNKWFCTLGGGVSKFDGLAWTNYAISATHGLASNSINDIAIDDLGNKWFATNGGVSLFNDTTWIKYTTHHGLVNDYVNSVTIENNGNKWFGTSGGISKFTGSIWTNYTTADGLVNNTVHSIAIDDQGNKWIGTDGGISKFNGSAWTNYTTADGLINSFVRRVAIDRKGNTWFATDGGLSKFDGSQWTNYPKNLNFASYQFGINSFIIDAKGDKWLGKDTYLYKFNDTTWTTYAPQFCYQSSLLVTADALDNKLAASWEGIWKFNDTQWTFLCGTSDFKLTESYLTYTSFAIDNSGNFWHGCYGVTKTVLCAQVPDAPVISLNDNVIQSSASDGNHWYLNGKILPDQTNRTYSPLKSGNYYATVAMNGCTSKKSNVISFISTGINDISESDIINISPNPTIGIVKVTLDKTMEDDFVVSVYNNVGMLIESMKKKKSDQVFEVDLSKHSSGFYIVHINGVSASFKLKVIKK